MNLVKKNQKLHNPNLPLMIGDVKEGGAVKDVNESIYRNSHKFLKEP